MNLKIKKLVRDAFLLALLCISSYLEIPMGFVPFTMQLLVILIIILITNTFEAFLIVFTFIIMGLIGLPVFSSGGGIAYLLKPSFGFIIGFMLMPFIKYLIEKIFIKMIKRKELLFLIITIICVIIDYIIGFGYVVIIAKWLKIIELNMSIGQMFVYMILIFVPFDVVKCVIASLVVPKIKKIQGIE